MTSGTNHAFCPDPHGLLTGSCRVSRACALPSFLSLLLFSRPAALTSLSLFLLSPISMKKETPEASEGPGLLLQEPQIFERTPEFLKLHYPPLKLTPGIFYGR